MKKPERKDCPFPSHKNEKCPCYAAHMCHIALNNKICENWEAYIKENFIPRDKLLSEDEIHAIMIAEVICNPPFTNDELILYKAKAIHKEQGGK